MIDLGHRQLPNRGRRQRFKGAAKRRSCERNCFTSAFAPHTHPHNMNFTSLVLTGIRCKMSERNAVDVSHFHRSSTRKASRQLSISSKKLLSDSSHSRYFKRLKVCVFTLYIHIKCRSSLSRSIAVKPCIFIAVRLFRTLRNKSFRCQIEHRQSGSPVDCVTNVRLKNVTAAARMHA